MTLRSRRETPPAGASTHGKKIRGGNSGEIPRVAGRPRIVIGPGAPHAGPGGASRPGDGPRHNASFPLTASGEASSV
jgi:hypothetical protein